MKGRKNVTMKKKSRVVKHCKKFQVEKRKIGNMGIDQFRYKTNNGIVAKFDKVRKECKDFHQVRKVKNEKSSPKSYGACSKSSVIWHNRKNSEVTKFVNSTSKSGSFDQVQEKVAKCRKVGFHEVSQITCLEKVKFLPNRKNMVNHQHLWSLKQCNRESSEVQVTIKSEKVDDIVTRYTMQSQDVEENGQVETIDKNNSKVEIQQNKVI